MKPLLFSVLTPYTRAQRASLFLQLLLFFGGITAGVGAWVGKTFVFEPLPTDPEITRVEVLVPTPHGPRSGIALVEVDLDRMGRCGIWIGGKIHCDGEVCANKHRFILHGPGFDGWYPLPEEARPAWLSDLRVRAARLSKED